MSSGGLGSPGRGARLLLLGAAVGLAGETLLFMGRQCRQVAAVLADDFRVLAFLASDMAESKAMVVAEKVRSIPGTADARFVSREAALAALQERDPDLVRSVAILGENPLNPALEVRLEAEALARMPEWLKAAEQMPEVGELRFKPGQAAAIVQAQFYERFIAFVLSVAAFIWALAAASGVMAAARGPGVRSAAGLLGACCWAGAGTLLGIGGVALAAAPLSSVARLWAWPAALPQALLLAAGSLAAFLFPEAPEGEGRSRRARRRLTDMRARAAGAAQAEGASGAGPEAAPVAAPEPDAAPEPEAAPEEDRSPARP